ncbi:UDP-N-acetylmuramoyl-tripeptide--D-alanyl-D-alanine ligase [uncultured Halovibrio sp.]|uniref:UDP-N-acetylmuramoyl-tripeptide--D-alanyl-D- alanine ligase n=1 Tax=uncultured Halovibrio sp. TaxID=985049 RepID=UPI0025CC30BE|nr:UDP-N-acetylmuramoyl-tripeptide--D-alanyl-D-alanine ligase [uncultured Halovibrio sp.]
MMRAFSLAEITPLVQGTLRGEDLFFSRVGIDTRTLAKGGLYVALSGDRYDGHDFVREAEKAGACAIVAEKKVDASMPVIQVRDSRYALGRLAGLNRAEFAGKLVGITGSSGKTTTRQMMQTVLAEAGSVMATEGNLNNEIGAPLTLLQLGPDAEFAVVELGASGLGEIAWTGSLAAPDVGIITNASAAHLEGFGSLENIVSAKGEIIDSVRAGGTVILNHDEAAFEDWRARAGMRRVLSISAQGDQDASFRAESIREDADGIAFTLLGDAVTATDIRLPIPGRHNVANALLVAAAAHSLGLDMDRVARGLANTPAVAGRLEPITLRPGIRILNDSYNANPASMAAALRTLAAMPAPRFALLGDMAELGSEAASQHRALGELARQLGIEQLMVTGSHASDYADGFGDGTHTGDAPESLADRVWDELGEAASILVKGSRSAGMDRAVTRLRERNDDAC